MRRRVTISLVAALAFTVTNAVGSAAHDHTPSASKGSLGSTSQVEYRYVGFNSGSTLAATVDVALEEKFHHQDWNNSKIPTLAYSASGTAQVIYSSSPTSPCAGNSSWLQCANNGGSASWRIYIRNFGSSGASSWHWDELQNCSGGTCWYLKRALIHESGHTMVTFPDLSGASESDTVMNGNSPPIGATGGNHFVFRRCDEAAIQLIWDLDDLYGEYADCFDHLTSHGGLVTEMSVGGSSYTKCTSVPAYVGGRAQIKDTTSTGSGTGTYGPMAKNPLAGRTIRIQRKPSTSSSWTTYSALTTTADASSGSNWVKVLPAATGIWNYRAYYDGDTSQDLLADGPASFNVTWTDC